MYVAKKKFTYITSNGEWKNLLPGQEFDLSTAGDVLLASLINVGHVVKKEVEVAVAASPVEYVPVEGVSTDNRVLQQGKRKNVPNEQS